MKKLCSMISVLLILCTLLSLVACGNDTPGGKNPSGTSPSGSGNGNGTQENVNYLESLPDLPDSDIDEFRILVTQQLVDFYDQENETSDVVDNACFKRNFSVEERFDVDIVYTNLDGNASGSADFAAEVRTTTLGGRETCYDLILGQNYYTLPMVSEGMYHDLMTSNHFNWDADWYHHDINENGTVNGHLYAASGTFVTAQLAYAMACFYSKTVYERYGFEQDLYQLVRDKQWTFEVFYEMATYFEDSYVQDGTDNTYGCIVFDHGINGLIIGLGVNFVEKDVNGSWTAENFYTPRVEDIYGKMRALFNDYSSISAKVQEDYARGNIMSHLLFCPTLVQALLDDELLMQSEQFKIGILPMPLYDSTQEDYRTRIMRDELFLIPSSANLENSAIMTEALNYKSMELVNPAYWDKALELRSSDTAEDREMLQIISATVYSSTAQYFNSELNSFCITMGTEVLKNSYSFSTWWGRNKKVVGRQLENIIGIYGVSYDKG